MSDLWYVLIIVAAAVVVFLVLRARRTAERTRHTTLAGSDDGSRNYAQERETDRMSHMSDSDQAWQAASLQRNRDNQARKQTPPTKS
jgi:membrane protein implicated in regulation of membrane protease activity